MDIKLDNPIVETSEVSTPQNETVPEGMILMQEIGNLFDLTPREISMERRKINTLLDYARLKTEDHSPMSLKWAIRSLSMKLGTPPLGEKLISYLTKYAYLYLETHKMKKELDKYEGSYDNSSGLV